MLSVSSITRFIQVVKADSGTAYIRADGSIDPPTAPIQRNGNVYTLTGNITSDAEGIFVERDNILIDGSGFAVEGIGADSSNGIDLDERSNVTIQNTNIKDFYAGIRLAYSSSNSISGNNITKNKYGIDLDNSPGNNISGNNITKNTSEGILLGSSSNNNSVSGNNITDNGYDISNGYGVGLFSSSNISISGNSITTNNLFGIWLISSSNVSISGNNMAANSGYGIYLGGDSTDNTIVGNSITNNSLHGIDLAGSSDNSISGNNIANNWYGVLGDFSSSNIVCGNNITTNYNDGVGFLYSSNCTISGNNIANNEYGINLYGSSDNSISQNTIANNRWGIDLHSSNQKIHHNNFVNNTWQVNSHKSINAWDDGYPSGGNYWSDYAGLDLDHNGIGDTAYAIDANNTDNYPLMGIYSSFKVWVPPYPTGGFENVDVITNFTILDLNLYAWLTTPNQYLQAGQLYLSLTPVQRQNMTAGFCRMTIPNNILNTSDYIVLTDMTPISVNKLFGSNSTHTVLYFAFNPSDNDEIMIVPEFPSFLILPLFMIATLLAVAVFRRKQPRVHRQEI